MTTCQSSGSKAQILWWKNALSLDIIQSELAAEPQVSVFAFNLATSGFFHLHPIHVSPMTAQALSSLIFARHKTF